MNYRQELSEYWYLVRFASINSKMKFLRLFFKTIFHKRQNLNYMIYVIYSTLHYDQVLDY